MPLMCQCVVSYKYLCLINLRHLFLPRFRTLFLYPDINLWNTYNTNKNPSKFLLLLMETRFYFISNFSFFQPTLQPLKSLLQCLPVPRPMGRRFSLTLNDFALEWLLFSLARLMVAPRLSSLCRCYLERYEKQPLATSLHV